MISKNWMVAFGFVIFGAFLAVTDALVNTKFGQNATNFMKKWAREATKGHGEKYSNCSCPPDAPIDDSHEFCGYEIKSKTTNVNPCKDQTYYRCMDPYPWKAIEVEDCTQLKDVKNKPLPVRECGFLPSGRAPTGRSCNLPEM
jgi:hypothetical protein